MNALWIWLAASATYLGFRVWYDGWRDLTCPSWLYHFLC
jgi:hypothetical protein